MPKVVVIGIDCMTPQLLFDKWLDELPTFKRLCEAGTWGRLKSVNPPITVPAWSCMMSGYKPAQLGLYGFRHRVIGTYDDLYFATSKYVNKPRAWQLINDAGYTAAILGVPQTFPMKKVKGIAVSGFLATDTDSVFTFPDKLREELEEVCGEPYMLDVPNFRSDDRDRILADIDKLMRQRFKVFRHFIENRPQDFMMMVEMGCDRIHHAFWAFIDPEHPRYVPGNKYENVVLDFYKGLDEEIAQTLELLDEDTEVFVVSDHGARPMVGGFAINDWLVDQGLLVLKGDIEPGTRISPGIIDFEKTRVWAWGGYYARIFVNVAGREPHGMIAPEELDAFLTDLTSKIEALDWEDGSSMGNKVIRPDDLTEGGAQGDKPDLMVYFGDLKYRSIGSVGYDSYYQELNDTGPDDANHDHYGIFVHTTTNRLAAGESGPGMREGLQLIDIGPTVVSRFGASVAEDAAGKPIPNL